MGRAVILRHELSDGSHHFDLLIEPDAGESDPDERVLVAWRLPGMPARGVASTLAAERLPPHRRLYLDFEGSISGDRGRVVRAQAGTGEILADEGDRFYARLLFDTVALRVEAVPALTGAWSLTFCPT